MARIASAFTCVVLFTFLSAAECVEQSPCATYFSTPVIFAGKVLSVSGPNGENPFENHVALEPGQPISVRFDVLKAIKGINTPQVTITMRAGSSECCYPFKRTKTYLVFARPYAGQLVTHGCDPNRLVQSLDKDGDIKVLLSMQQEANVEVQKQLCIAADAKRE